MITQLQRIGHELRYSDDKNFIGELIKYMSDGMSFSMAISNAKANAKKIFGDVIYIESQKEVLLNYKVSSYNNYHEFENRTIEQFWESLYSFMIVYSVSQVWVHFSSGATSRFSKDYVKEQMSKNSLPTVE